MWILIGIFFVISLIFLLVAFKLLVARGWLLAWLRGTSGILSGLIVITLSGLALSLLRFEPVIGSGLLQISTVRQPDKAFILELTTSQSDSVQVNTSGDLWTLSVRYLDLPDWLNSLGAPDLYQVTEASGRYLTFQQDMQSDAKQQELSSLSVDLWPVFEWIGPIGIWNAQSVRTQPVPVADGGLFQLVVTGGEFTVNGLNQPAVSALADWLK